MPAVIEENTPSRVDWEALYGQAARFKEIAPWHWMWDSNLFGVKNPEDGETGYCCVLGAAKEVFGIAVYLGCEGLEGYLKVMNHPDLIDDADAIHLKKCLLLTFEDQGALEKPDLQVMKDLGLRFMGSKAWPQFRCYLPGYYPWYLTAKEVRFLTICLNQASEVVLRFKEDFHLFDSRKKDCYFVKVQEGEPGQSEWKDVWLKPLPLKRIIQITKNFDSQRMKAIAALPQRQMAWEVDFFYSPAVIGEKGKRPYFPMMLLFSDHESCFIFNGHLTEPGRYLVELHEQLLQTFEKAKCLPEEILVQRQELQICLEPFCEQFGIGVTLVEGLPAIRDARRGMREFLGKGKRR